MKKVILFIASSVFFVSCEKTADIKLPVSPPMMAVFCFVEEGSQIVVKLEEVVPLFDKTRREPVPVEGAQVIIKEGGNTYVLVEGGGLPGSYSFPGQHWGSAGKSYELEVKKAGFPDLKAFCRVPDYVPTSVGHEYVAVPEPGRSGDSSRRIGFTWKDQPGFQNNYRFSALANFNGNQETPVYFSDKNLSDEQRDGEELFTGLGSFWSYSPSSYDSLEVTFELIALDEHALKYMRTFDAAIVSGDNPFAEPVIMYTNVQGGIGVFGGVNRKFFNIRIY